MQRYMSQSPIDAHREFSHPKKSWITAKNQFEIAKEFDKERRKVEKDRNVSREPGIDMKHRDTLRPHRVRKNDVSPSRSITPSSSLFDGRDAEFKRSTYARGNGNFRCIIGHQNNILGSILMFCNQYYSIPIHFRWK